MLGAWQQQAYTHLLLIKAILQIHLKTQSVLLLFLG